MIHQLKVESEFFNATIERKKEYEIRLNDRDYKVGDFLALNEIEHTDAEHFEYTGRSTLVVVTHVLDDKRFLPAGFVALGIKPCGVMVASPSNSREGMQILGEHYQILTAEHELRSRKKDTPYR